MVGRLGRSLAAGMTAGAVVLAGSVVPAAGEVPAPGPHRAPSATPRTPAVQVYDLDFFTWRTADGAVALDPDGIRALVADVDAWYARTTQGRYRLRLRRIGQLPPTDGHVCDGTTAGSLIGRPAPPSPGSTGALWVVMTSSRPDGSQRCPYAGLATQSGAGVWMEEGSSDERRRRILAHEIGHNLGLGHSQSVVPSGSSPTWPAGVTPEIDTFGDVTDVMGWTGLIACEPACTWIQSDLHAHNLNLLGVLSAGEVGHVGPGESREVTLVPVDGGDGLRAVYLPWLDRAKFVLDFRPDSYLSGAAALPYGPGAGVYVRLVDTGADAGPAPYTAGGGTVAIPRPEVRPGSHYGIGHPPGSVVALPDGSRVTVLEVAGTYARVLVERPPDAGPPLIRPGLAAGCRSSPCRLGASRSRWDDAGGSYEITLDGPGGAVSDDVWTARLAARVDGRTALTLDRDLPGTGVRIDAEPRAVLRVGPGRHRIRVNAVDLTGATSTVTTTVVAARLVPPVRRWIRLPGLVRYGFVKPRNLRCPDRDQFCVGIAVQSLPRCRQGVAVDYAAITAGGDPVTRGRLRFERTQAGAYQVRLATSAHPMTATFTIDGVRCR